ncbi:MAG: hypothetical protein H6706_14260 [Myxococcales bacterium]|nr:hypothetical protein [Myxococcales bacterium]
MRLSVAAPALFLAALAGGCDSGGPTTDVRLELYAPYDGRTGEIQPILQGGSGADLIELVALQASDPYGTQITVDLDIARGTGKLPALPFGDDYWFFVRGFRRGDTENVPLFYGAAANVRVSDDAPLIISLQAGQADCIALNRTTRFGRDPNGTDDAGGLRTGASFTLLADGRVLIAGGGSVNNDGRLVEVHDSMEIYDPGLGQFIPVSARLLTPRAFHSATLLSDGRVLVVGGYTGPEGEGAVTSAASIIDVSGTPTVRAVQGLPADQARAHHAVSRLNDGRGSVLISGGVGPDGGLLASAWRFFPGDAAGNGERFERQGDLWVARAWHSQNRLLRQTELALAAGGLSEAGAQASVEVFSVLPTQDGCADPDQRPTAEKGCFLRLPQSFWLEQARFGHAAIEIEDGAQILFAGGYTAEDRASFATSLELIDDQLQRRTAGALPTGRGELSATVLPDQSVLLLGGRRGDSPVAISERLRPRREGDRITQYDVGELSADCELSEARYGHQAVRLQTGVVLIGGGVTGFQQRLVSSRRGELYFPRIRDIDRVYPSVR